MTDRPANRKRTVTRQYVVRTEWLTPQVVRVVVGGGGARAFVDNGFTDRYVKLVFPVPGVELVDGSDIDAVRRELPRHAWPTTRTYTVRRFDPDAGELTIDFVCHGDVGLAAPWAAAARPGDDLMLFGPGGAYAPSQAADWHLLVGDESALAAIASALEAMPAGARVRAFIEVADHREEQKLATEADAEITWLHRHATSTDGQLLSAVRSMAFPFGAGQAFVHGEAGFVADLRRHLRFERNARMDVTSISGYWRRGKNEDGWQAEKAETRRRELEQTSPS